MIEQPAPAPETGDRDGVDAVAVVDAVSLPLVPESLVDSGLAPLWAAVRQRLDRGGASARGAIRMPDIEPRCEPAVAALIGRSPTSRLDLADLETGLARLGVGNDLDAALARLGCPPDPASRERRQARARVRQVREELDSALEGWPETWSIDWGQEMLRSGLLGGLDAREAIALLGDVRRLLDHRVDMADRDTSRTELAAHLFGSAHSLDPGTKLAAAAERALRLSLGLADGTLQGRALWDAAGIAADSVSAPALTWGLRPQGASPLASMLGTAADAGVPMHVSLRVLREHRIEVAAATPVLVVENPSVVEAAAETSAAFGLVCTNGNPSSAVTELIDQLAASGASLRYHGDFDAAGIAICRRMLERGCTPWMMSAVDYRRAVQRAAAQGVPVLHDSAAAGPTPWDPALEAEFDRRRSIVHEEFVSAEFLREFGSHAAAQIGWQPSKFAE